MTINHEDTLRFINALGEVQRGMADVLEMAHGQEEIKKVSAIWDQVFIIQDVLDGALLGRKEVS